LPSFAFFTFAFDLMPLFLFIPLLLPSFAFVWTASSRKAKVGVITGAKVDYPLLMTLLTFAIDFKITFARLCLNCLKQESKGSMNEER